MSEGASPTKSRRGIPRAACRRLDKPNTLVLHYSDTVRAVLVSNRVFLRHSDTVRAVLVSNHVFLRHSDTVRGVATRFSNCSNLGFIA